MNRRQLLQGLSALGLGQFLLGCQSGNPNTLNVYVLKGALPPQLISRFRGQSKRPVTLKPEANLADLFAQLKTWSQRQPAPSRLVSLGDYWLAPAIQQGLLKPLQPNTFQHWDQLSSQWQALGRRDDKGNPAVSGKVWGVPYRYGGTLIVYRRDKLKSLGWTPTDWSDLWREDIKQRISLPDQAREVIGLTLKMLKRSYNTADPSGVADLETRLMALNRQVKFYSSTHYLQPLVLGDTWLAVGWSADILPLLKRESNLRAIVPASGTALWADLWVQTKGEAPSDDKDPTDMAQWIDFWWQSDIAEQLSMFTAALSPILRSPPPPPKQLAQSLADPDVLANSEFLLPLSPTAIEQYQQLWTQMRQRI